MPRYIDPARDLGGLLLTVEKPARYAGGEYGRLASKEAELRTAIAFPDLYEIGMSNQALRILYNRLNRIPGVSCDRAFAPAPDFEKLLREQNMPLYGLDTGICLAGLDLLMFTLGYELGISGVLTMLDVSGVPLRNAERTAEHPIVIAGGPAVSNPLPYAAFIDAFWIGEAEAGFFDLAAGLLELKKAGEGRAALLMKIGLHPNVWVQGKDKALRAIDADFAGRGGPPADTDLPAAVFPVPSMKVVQHHGAVEIMRGCPNGCRFCHAGYWYRPMRQKKPEQVVAEAAAFIDRGGYREISLSSLSSGDYGGIENLVDELNRLFGGRRVSFQLPSLRVSTFSLSLLEKISQTRKSGLTFAVETPAEARQRAINKTVTLDSVVEILREAKKRGWRGAKFYFMIGLPPEDCEQPSGPEESEIVDFIAAVGRGTNMRFNINVGIFVPKPHTPYQWAAQIDSAAAAAKLDYIRSKLRPLGHKVSVSDPLISLIEGVLSRGDERAGVLIEEAYRGGSRLDAWQEFINREQWLAIFEKNRDLIAEFLREKTRDVPLPWRGIGPGLAPGFLRKELSRAEHAEFTLPCIENCTERCGVCGKDVNIARNSIQDKVNYNEVAPVSETGSPSACRSLGKTDPSVRRVLFSFSKQGGAVFHGHLSLVEIFSMAFSRAQLPVLYTQGFNPLAKIEIAAPLSTGIGADAEIAAAEFAAGTAPEDFAERLNLNLPEGIRIEKAESYYIPSSWKKHSLASLLWGFCYDDGRGGAVVFKAAEEKQFRSKMAAAGFPLFQLRRAGVLAKDLINKTTETGLSYFEVFRFLYPPRAR
jgi:radical SAM superfamily enzyme YgiQ (UPF0313 family)